MSGLSRRFIAALVPQAIVIVVAVAGTTFWLRRDVAQPAVVAPAPTGIAITAREALAPSEPAGRDSIRFVEHPDVYPVGWPSNAIPLALANPFERNAKARETGARLYVSYNCIDCHGAEGSGSMGPSLADGRWHFGGSAAEVFESIFQGRPDGMPAWGGRISNDQIWMLVSYVRSLNGGRDVSTRNFTARAGRTVERSGH